MTTKNIQDVVAEKVEELNRLEEMCDGDSDQIVAMYRRNISTALTQLVKEVEAGEQERILQELKDETNNWKGTISHLTIEGIVTNWRDYEKVHHTPYQ